MTNIHYGNENVTAVQAYKERITRIFFSMVNKSIKKLELNRTLILMHCSWKLLQVIILRLYFYAKIEKIKTLVTANVYISWYSFH